MPRQYEQRIEIDAPADAVWEAIADARGIESWFAPQARVEPGSGGKIWVSWGPECEGESRIETWEPGHKLRYEHDRGGERGPSAIEFTIEARDGAHTILTLVNSGFGDDASFDAELETTSHAWGLFLYLLKYRAENTNSLCKNISVLKMIPAPHQEALTSLTASLKTRQHYWDPYGEACYELPDAPSSLIAIFCEPAGESTMVTVMALLYNAESARDQSTNAMIEALFGNLEATAAGGA